MIDKLCIIGVGLIGGSLAKALKKNNYTKCITGYDINENNLQIAKELNIIDSYSVNIEEALLNANIIVIAVPVNSFSIILKKIKPYLTNKTLITDVASTKLSVINHIKSILGENFNKFIPAHPIAGKEKSGNINADENLFINKKVIITDENNEINDVKIISKMWQKTGAIVEYMQAQEHDNIFALSSHLPHILAFCFVNYMAQHQKAHNYTGGGFKDFSRIAASDATMWADICLNNKDNIIEYIKEYQDQLNLLQKFIKNQDYNSLITIFNTSKKMRNNWIKS